MIIDQMNIHVMINRITQWLVVLTWTHLQIFSWPVWASCPSTAPSPSWMSSMYASPQWRLQGNHVTPPIHSVTPLPNRPCSPTPHTPNQTFARLCTWKATPAVWLGLCRKPFSSSHQVMWLTLNWKRWPTSYLWCGLSNSNVLLTGEILIKNKK